METLERIINLMKDQEISDLEMEKRIGATRRSFSNWKRRKGRSYYEYIDKIADQLGVTIDFLIRGEDLKTDSLTHEEIVLINNFRNLVPEERKLIIDNSYLWQKK